ncbi:hypothetical protein [Streptomyces sp. NPDC052107]|uniref:hypothetical protein n=1 Tax=Streptomyces sp. NPDC052107 TaxID=3155632 RepID=UPI00342D61C0
MTDDQELDFIEFWYCLRQAMKRHFGERDPRPRKLHVAYGQLSQLYVHAHSEFGTIVACVGEALREPA